MESFMNWRQYYDVKVTMRDGVELACDVRLPGNGKSFPAVLLRTPYNKNIHPESNRMDNITNYLENGYAMVIMDVRGKYESDGSFPVMDFSQEGRDGADTIAWIRKQPWSNGRVAMTGASYCGYVQVYAAIEHPEGLCAITPGVFGNDGFINIMRRNGIPQISLLVWAMYNASGRVAKSLLVDWKKELSDLPLNTLPRRCGFPGDFVGRWLSHNRKDSFWESMGQLEIMRGVDTPVLLTGGWYDIYASAIIENFGYLAALPQMKNKVKLLIGPWVHGLGAREAGEIDFGPSAEMDITEENRCWLDIWCKEDGMSPELPSVRYFMMGRNEWRDSECWPPPGVVWRELLLAGDSAANSLDGGGCLSERHGRLAADHYRYDPADPVISLGGNLLALGEDMPAGPRDQRPMERRADVLVYTGEELSNPLEITGQPEAELFVCTDVPDTDFVVRLCDVYPDGRSINITSGIIRTRYRAGFDREVMMPANRIVRLKIGMDATAHCFLPGHRLRLEVTSSSFPQFARNHNTGGDGVSETAFRVASQTIWHSPEYPSILRLPVYGGESAAAGL